MHPSLTPDPLPRNTTKAVHPDARDYRRIIHARLAAQDADGRGPLSITQWKARQDMERWRIKFSRLAGHNPSTSPQRVGGAGELP